jgi:hypothetical protein
MKRALSVLAGCIVMGGCAVPQPQLDDPTSISGQTTITGCLNPAAAPGQFVLSERHSGAKIPVSGHPRLGLYADNHAVRIVGIVGRESSGQGLKAIKIDQIAGSCVVPF